MFALKQNKIQRTMINDDRSKNRENVMICYLNSLLLNKNQSLFMLIKETRANIRNTNKVFFSSIS